MGALRFNTQCINCIYNKYIRVVPDGTPEPERLRYAKNLLRIIADADDTLSAPEIVALVTELKNNTFGFKDDFAELKAHFNELMLSYEQDLEKKISESKDPFYTALCCALFGNYIDFGAMDSVDESKLKELLSTADSIEFRKDELENLKADLKKARYLVYATDNCGEVVTDKLFIKEIKREYPDLQVDVLVRGEPVLNDATIEDARQVGLTEAATVTGNGTNIAGTCLDKVPENIKEILDRADLIIAKGQGNFETLCYCGKNVYYLFMCKCKMFSEKFNVPPFSGMLLNDLRMK